MVGRLIQSKLVELLTDVQKIAKQHCQNDQELIIAQIKENIEQKKLYKLEFSKKGPQEISSSDTYDISNGELMQKENFFPYINIETILIDALKEKHMFNWLYSNKGDWKTSLKFKELHEEDIPEIHIALYGDEITLTQPLSHRSVKHHYYMLYGSFLNIPQQARSSEHSIFLISMINSSELKRIGINAFLKPFVEDLNKMKTFKYCNYIFKLKLGVVCADTPAAQELGGNFQNCYI